MNLSTPPLSHFSELQKLLHSSNQMGMVLGCGSPEGLAWLLSSDSVRLEKARCHLCIFSTLDELDRFRSALKALSPQLEVFCLKHFDTSPFQGGQPRRQEVFDRLLWLEKATNSLPGQVFAATQQGLLQKTLPFSVFSAMQLKFKVGDELPPDIQIRLQNQGYHQAPLVEDPGSYSLRGSILDIFAPSIGTPLRIETFGDEIESLRFFDPESQRSLEKAESVTIGPGAEVLYGQTEVEKITAALSQQAENRPVESHELHDLFRSIGQENRFWGIDFLTHLFYESPGSPLEYLNCEFNVWELNPNEVERTHEQFLSEFKDERATQLSVPICPEPSDLFFEKTISTEGPSPEQLISVSRIEVHQKFDEDIDRIPKVQFEVSELFEFFASLKKFEIFRPPYFEELKKKFSEQTRQGQRIVILYSLKNQLQRIRLIFQEIGLELKEEESLESYWPQIENNSLTKITAVSSEFPRSLRLSAEKILILRAEDLLKKQARAQTTKETDSDKRAQILNFSELGLGDLIVHKNHGVGEYRGLLMMSIQGFESEFIELHYRGKDKLFLPVYRVGQIQKYSGPNSQIQLDKLGGSSWEAAKTKVKHKLQDIAQDLLKLYAARAQLKKNPLPSPGDEYHRFEGFFPFEETRDQQRTIDEIMKDLCSERPMDRLLCGDVGFGKTEVAMRAAFHVAQSGQQVAFVAPTTVLSFQHLETLKKRFAPWAFEIRSLNRFVSPKEVKDTLRLLKEGKVDIVVGTHRLLSQDVQFNNLGLLILDEEQKFGVKHKEKLRKLKKDVDSLAMSATPIPRTMNMSLMGIRDLSLISTPPVNRLPTRTFVCQFEGETIRRAILNEMKRGGQVYFIHNRVESIYELADRLRALVPEARLQVAHGQLPERDLEKIMVSFFNKETDVLLSTAIVESGMDVSNANTIFIDRSHAFGLSQLYQLRGRVGRSKERAYCYLLVPKNRKLDKIAEERLRVIQTHTELGSGFKIAHYDLELRGSGNLLGEDQSGHIAAVGYELYLELLEEALQEAKGEPQKAELDPEINLRVPAFIPDSYIPDIRSRLGVYKQLSQIREVEDIDQIESDLRDQYGSIPEPVFTLFGVMSIRKLCRDLGVSELSAGPRAISLKFTELTPLSPEKAISLSQRPNKKYSLTPDSRLTIRMKEITWENVYGELETLLKEIDRA